VRWLQVGRLQARWLHARRLHARGLPDLGWGMVSLAMVWGILLLWVPDARAYSYAAAGAEPLIEAREKTLAALNEEDFDAARAAAEAAKAEFDNLDQEFGHEFRAQLEQALNARDEQGIDRVYLEVFRVEVARRLAAASKNLSDYQQAKTLVVKSKRFFDLIAPRLSKEGREQGDAALRACLESIGNPGVFGVGAREADPAAFERSRKSVVESLGSLAF